MVKDWFPEGIKILPVKFAYLVFNWTTTSLRMTMHHLDNATFYTAYFAPHCIMSIVSKTLQATRMALTGPLKYI